MARKTGETKPRSLRVPDEQWDRWKEAVEADPEITTISDRIREFMDRYADQQLGRKK